MLNYTICKEANVGFHAQFIDNATDLINQSILSNVALAMISVYESLTLL